MFEGEMASLTAILKTGTVKVPKPIKVLDAPGGGSMLVMEHLDMRYLSRSVLLPSSQVKYKDFIFPLYGSFLLTLVPGA
jgi:protein-ribulosamine 3-kinase